MLKSTSLLLINYVVSVVISYLSSVKNVDFIKSLVIVSWITGFSEYRGKELVFLFGFFNHSYLSTFYFFQLGT